MDLFITIALLSLWVKYLHFFERTGEMKNGHPVIQQIPSRWAGKINPYRSDATKILPRWGNCYSRIVGQDKRCTFASGRRSG